MTVLRPRSRMISVRLSEDEYESLRRMCVTTGARSVSDLTRDAMQTLLNNSSRESDVSSYLNDFRAQITTLDRKIEELTELMTPSKTEVQG
jgi:Arc/MetJ-type ribon-helix-helix transcriptional regulator